MGSTVRKDGESSGSRSPRQRGRKLSRLCHEAKHGGIWMLGGIEKVRPMRVVPTHQSKQVLTPPTNICQGFTGVNAMLLGVELPAEWADAVVDSAPSGLLLATHEGTSHMPAKNLLFPGPELRER